MMAAPLTQNPQSALQVAKKILQIDGPKGFTRGLAPVLLRAFPVNASALFVYEGLMKLLGAEKVRKLYINHILVTLVFTTDQSSLPSHFIQTRY